uniref:Histone deacetylase 7b n=1 Tax=Astyanax mexicanus TaxID=7994 RepID=W5L0J4_ASTMX
MFSLQRQMFEQHLRMEGARERGKEGEEREKERQALKQLWDKGKSQYSAVASPWVKQKLRQLIKQKNEQAESNFSSIPTGFRNLTPIPDLNFQHLQQNSSSSLIYGSDRLRRTHSEPLIKLKLRRSISNRRNPLCHKSSAPPTVCIPASECSLPSSQSNSGLLAWNYTGKQFHKSQSHLDCGMMEGTPMQPSTYLYVTPDQETLGGAFSSAAPSFYVSNDPRYPSVLTSPHPQVQQVLVVGPERPLIRSKSQPAFFITQYSPPPYIFRSYSSQRKKKTRQTQEGEAVKSKHGELKAKGKMNSGHLFNEEYVQNNEQQSSLNSTSYTTPARQQRSSFRRNAGFRHALKHREMSRNLCMADIKEPCTENCITGVVCNSEMQNTQCTCRGSNPPSDLTNSVWSRLQKCGLIKQCKKIPGRKATTQEIQSVYQENSSVPYGTNHLGRLNLASAKMAAGSVTELVLRVAQGELKNGFAIVKPCGTSDSESGSFSSFSSVAIAAKQLQHRLCDKKILIVDWDIHHAEIVQNVFYTDPKVLYISLHRKDTLSPARGGPTDVGSGDAVGFNVNVPWSDKLETIGDAEYLAAFRTVVLPIGRQFSPDVVLVSSEFNAVDGHPASSGGHRVSANCFGFLTQRLMDLAKDGVVLVLEGGHDIMAICDASEACVKALLNYKFVAPSEDVLKKRPCAKAVQCLQKVLRIQSKYWSSVNAEAHTVDQPWFWASGRCFTDSDASSAMASLSMSEADSSSSQSRFCHGPMEHDENETY